jgi:hypothetical protein
MPVEAENWRQDSATERRPDMATTRSRSPSREGKTRARAETIESLPEISIELTEEDITAHAEVAVTAAYEKAEAEIGPELAEVMGWWDIAGYGPIQVIAPGQPLLPHAVIKVGEQAFVLALVLLNPFQALPGGTNAGDVLSNFALPYEIRYQAGNLTNWTLGQPDMQAVHTGNLVPGQYFYVDVLGFTGSQPGLYEMNISARLLGAAPPNISAPQFGAFATTVFSLDAPGLFGPAPPSPMRFQVYA